MKDLVGLTRVTRRHAVDAAENAIEGRKTFKATGIGHLRHGQFRLPDEKPLRFPRPHEHKRAAKSVFRIFEQQVQMSHRQTKAAGDQGRGQVDLVILLGHDVEGEIAQPGADGAAHFGQVFRKAPARR